MTVGQERQGQTKDVVFGHCSKTRFQDEGWESREGSGLISVFPMCTDETLPFLEQNFPPDSHSGWRDTFSAVLWCQQNGVQRMLRLDISNK